MTARALVRLDPDDGDLLVVTGPGGEELHRSGLAASSARIPRHPADEDERDDAVRALADEDLRAAGWAREGGWAPASEDGRRWAAVLRALPREPLGSTEERALHTLRRLTGMARNPVTADALVPHTAPRRHDATVLLRRLVAAGHVRVVGRTVERVPHDLYAPVGSTWAPAREDAGGR